MTTQITFRNITPSGGIENDIRERIDHLETFHPDLIACRVTVEVPHQHRAHGRSIHVRVELSLPGEDVVVDSGTRGDPSAAIGSHKRHKHEDVDARHKDAAVAIRDAFDAARRRLQDAARRQRHAVKARAQAD